MALDDTITLLLQAPLLGLLERDALRLVAFSAETRRLRPGEVLFRQGERSDGGYLVLEGEFDIARSGSDETAVVGPGSLIGRMALFVRLLRPAGATARTRCNVLRISPTLMRRVLEEFPGSAAAMRDDLASDLADLTDDLDRVRAMMLAIDGDAAPPAS